MHLKVLKYQHSEERVVEAAVLFLKAQLVPARSLLGQEKEIKADLETFQHVWTFSADIFLPFKVEAKATDKIKLYWSTPLHQV